MNAKEKAWRKSVDIKIQSICLETLINNCGNSNRVKYEVIKKQQSMNEKKVDIGAMVSMMVRGGYLPMRGITKTAWMYDDE